MYLRIGRLIFYLSLRLINTYYSKLLANYVEATYYYPMTKKSSVRELGLWLWLRFKKKKKKKNKGLCEIFTRD
jgi:hypothetical protein